MTVIPNSTGDLYAEIKLRNFLRVRYWISNNLNLFKSNNWQEIMQLLRQAGILTSWNTIFCTLDIPDHYADKLCELDEQLLHPNELTTITEA